MAITQFHAEIKALSEFIIWKGESTVCIHRRFMKAPGKVAFDVSKRDMSVELIVILERKKKLNLVTGLALTESCYRKQSNALIYSKQKNHYCKNRCMLSGETWWGL